MINIEELKDFLKDELEFEIKQLGNVYEQDELINIGATVYTLNKVLNKIKELEGVDDNDAI